MIYDKMLINKAQNETQQAHTNSNEEENEAYAKNSWKNFSSQTNREATIMVPGSITKVRAKRLQDGLNACL